MQLPLFLTAGNLRAMKKAPSHVRSRHAGRRSAGFTLLELMVSITVLTIVLSIAVPSFMDTTRRNRLTAQTNGLMSALAIARSEAVKRGTPVTVCPAAALAGVGADQCSANTQWAANGWLILADVRAPLGQVNVEAAAPANENDAILQRMPPASDQNIRVANALTSLTYRPDGSIGFPVGTVATTFQLSPDRCVNPQGAREVQVISSGRASFRKIACP